MAWSKVVSSDGRINSKYYSLWEPYQPLLAVFSVETKEDLTGGQKQKNKKGK